VNVQQMWLDLRRRWVWILVSAALVGGAGVLMSSLAQPAFVSTARLYLSTEIQRSDPEKLYAQYQITSARVASQMELLQSGLMEQEVAELLSSNGSTAEAQDVTVTSPLNTVVIDVQVSADTPEDARELANAYAEVAGRLIPDIEGEGSPISVTVIDQPELGKSVTRGPVANLMVGALLGASLAAVAIVVAGQLRRRGGDPGRVRS
jgi:polysaccharide biosynthesis transport protein